MNFGRSPILIIVGLFLVFIIFTSILGRRSSSSLNDKDRALRTQQTLTRVMNAEAAYLKQNGKYAGHVADLVPLDIGGNERFRFEEHDGYAIAGQPGSLDFRDHGGFQNNTYFLSRLRIPAAQNDKRHLIGVKIAVVDGKVVAKSCLQLKSAGKAYCTRKTSQIKKSLPAT